MQQMNTFNEFNIVKNIAKKYIVGTKKQIDFLQNVGLNVECSIPKRFYSEQEQERIFDLLSNIVSSNNGIVKVNKNSYVILFEELQLEVTISLENEEFSFELKKENIRYITGDNQNLILLLYILCNPTLIDEASFYYVISFNDEETRYLKRDDALNCFKNLYKNILIERDLISYLLDTSLTNGIIETKDNRILLTNYYETDDVKFGKDVLPIDIAFLLNFENQDDYDLFGFKFLMKDNRNILLALQIILEDYHCSIKSSDNNSISIINKNLDILKISLIRDNLTKMSFVDIPFYLTVQTTKNRISTLHKTTIEKRFFKPTYNNGSYSLNDLLKFIDIFKEIKLENLYTVFFNSQSTNTEFGGVSSIQYDSFEDALYLPKGFLDLVESFEKVEINTKQKFGNAFHNKDGTNAICAVATTEKMINFYANVMRMNHMENHKKV